jgi:hypothetical protein
MAVHRCSHRRQVVGGIQCDLSRLDGQSALYTAQFKVMICSKCGRMEFYCESHDAVCQWLAGKASEEEGR